MKDKRLRFRVIDGLLIAMMILPLVIFAAAIVVMGVHSQPLMELLESVAAAMNTAVLMN